MGFGQYEGGERGEVIGIEEGWGRGGTEVL